jgi:hypothetical protein
LGDLNYEWKKLPTSLQSTIENTLQSEEYLSPFSSQENLYDHLVAFNEMKYPWHEKIGETVFFPRMIKLFRPLTKKDFKPNYSTEKNFSNILLILGKMNEGISLSWSHFPPELQNIIYEVLEKNIAVFGKQAVCTVCYG